MLLTIHFVVEISSGAFSNFLKILPDLFPNTFIHPDCLHSNHPAINTSTARPISPWVPSPGTTYFCPGASKMTAAMSVSKESLETPYSAGQGSRQ